MKPGQRPLQEHHDPPGFEELALVGSPTSKSIPKLPHCVPVMTQPDLWGRSLPPPRGSKHYLPRQAEAIKATMPSSGFSTGKGQGKGGSVVPVPAAGSPGGQGTPAMQSVVISIHATCCFVSIPTEGQKYLGK